MTMPPLEPAISLGPVIAVVLIAGVLMALWANGALSRKVKTSDVPSGQAPVSGGLNTGALFLLLFSLLVFTYISLVYLTPATFLLGFLVWGLLALGFWYSRVVKSTTRLHSEHVRAALPGNVPGPLVHAGKGAFAGKPALVLVPELTDGDLVAKSFSWGFQPQPFPPYAQVVPQTISMSISEGRYEEMRNLPPLGRGQWSKYAVAKVPELDVLAAHFANLHNGKNWSTFQQASNLLAFVQQCIRFAQPADVFGIQAGMQTGTSSDTKAVIPRNIAGTGTGVAVEARSDGMRSPVADQVRSPNVTLWEETGSEADHLLLAVAVLVRLGFKTALLYYPDRLALGVGGAERLPGRFVDDPTSGNRYFYAQCNSKGVHIGEIPDGLKGNHPEMIEVVQVYPEEELLNVKGGN